MITSQKTEDLLLVVANFANVHREFRIGVPCPGKYQEILNTDAVAFGGEGRCNEGELCSDEIEWDGRQDSIAMVSAPLSVSIFSYQPYSKEEQEELDRRKAEAERKRKEELLEKERQGRLKALEQ